MVLAPEVTVEAKTVVVKPPAPPPPLLELPRPPLPPPTRWMSNGLDVELTVNVPESVNVCTV
jgi:hypothetical protein